MPPLPDPRPLRVLGKDLNVVAGGATSVASGLASGEEPTPQLAAQAVHRALERIGSDCAGSILLFLTADFSRNTQAAVTAASRAGHCLQVTGCCVPGVFTEDDWLIDRPGAASLVGERGCIPVRGVLISQSAVGRSGGPYGSPVSSTALRFVRLCQRFRQYRIA